MTAAKYSIILLSQHPWDWTGAGLSNIPDYQTVHTLTKVLTGNFLLLFLYLGCVTNQRSIPFGFLLQLLVEGCQGPFLCFLESLQFALGMLKD
jgi:hypothetical protein